MASAGSKRWFPASRWAAAKEEARLAMIEAAENAEVIAYSELVRRIISCSLEPHGQPLADLLGEISTEEDRAGRGMLSVVVVHKTGDQKPGPGFFKLAESLGRDITDSDACWVTELNKAHAAWKKP